MYISKFSSFSHITVLTTSVVHDIGLLVHSIQKLCAIQKKFFGKCAKWALFSNLLILHQLCIIILFLFLIHYVHGIRNWLDYIRGQWNKLPICVGASLFLFSHQTPRHRVCSIPFKPSLFASLLTCSCAFYILV